MKPTLSIVIPTYNDADFLKGCLLSIVKKTFHPWELILINNGSDEIQKTNTPWDLIDTKKFLDSIQVNKEGCSVKVIHYPKNVFINKAWNHGAEISTGEYVVLMNSDITLSKNWDKLLIDALEKTKRTIACPFERNPQTQTPFSLDLFMRINMPNMIKGPCFMFRKSDVPALFPIPEEIVHWCGDNVLADRAEKMGGVVFVRDAQIYHYVTQSGKRMDQSEYTQRVFKDVLAYEKWSGKDMECVKKNFSPELRAKLESKS